MKVRQKAFPYAGQAAQHDKASSLLERMKTGAYPVPSDFPSDCLLSYHYRQIVTFSCGASTSAFITAPDRPQSTDILAYLVDDITSAAD